MNYTHGESAQYKLHDRLQTARERAAIIELETLEAHNMAAQKRLDAYIAERDREAGRYPVDPNWRQHRAILNRELTAYDRARRSTSVPGGRMTGSVVGGNGLGGMVGQGDDSRRLASAFQGVAA